MKFDLIIGNPPYDKSLHLKILKKAMEYCDFDNGGEIVWLSPIDKWQSSIKHKENLYVPITKVFPITQETMNDVFKICNWVGGGITFINNKSTNNWKNFEYIVPYINLYRKIADKNITKLKNKFKKNPDKFPLRFFNGCNCDASHNYTISPTKYTTATSNKKSGHVLFCNFNSDLERKNCWLSNQTKFIKMCCYFDLWYILPWMGEAINPRTGLKGYLSEWTDEDFFEYFGLTEDEMKLIKDTMEKHLNL